MQWYIAYVLVFFQQIIDMRKKRPELRMTLNEKVAIVLVLSQMLTMTQNYIQVQEVIQWADEILRESEKETNAPHLEPETKAKPLEY
jgi:urease gamma subunit